MSRVVVITGASRGVGAMLASHFRDLGDTVVDVSRSSGWDVGKPGDLYGPIGRCDVLINNAGVGPIGFAMTTPEEAIEEAVSTNLLGTIYVSRAMAKFMPEGGRIVNIGSIHSVLRPVGASIYTATKVACEAFAAVLSKELAPRGITVNTLGLSPTDTDMYRSLSETARQKFLAMLPIPRLATPEDICNAIDFFCSPASGMVTGQTIYLGGIA